MAGGLQKFKTTCLTGILLFVGHNNPGHLEAFNEVYLDTKCQR